MWKIAGPMHINSKMVGVRGVAYICVYAYMYICMYVCMYVCVRIHFPVPPSGEDHANLCWLKT